MMNKIYWEDLFKIRLASSDDSFQKYEVVKLLLVMKLIQKYHKDKNFIRIYTEFDLDNNKKCDIYFENARTKEAFAIEIQRVDSTQWTKETTEKYRDWNVYNMNTSDLIIIPLKNAPNDISELNKWLEQYIF